MSEFTNHKQDRVKELVEFAQKMMSSTDKGKLVKENMELINAIVPSEVITLFDVLTIEQENLDDMKVTTNKILHLFNAPLKKYPAIKPAEYSFLDMLIKNNLAMVGLLNVMKVSIKSLNKNPADQKAKKELSGDLVELQNFEKHYQIKENVLFPALEKHWPDFHCVQLMWSYHDDIRRQIKELKLMLDEPQLKLKSFNRLAGNLFFNMHAIRFREEYILVPHILETIPEKAIDQMLIDSLEIGFPYVLPKEISKSSQKVFADGTKINLGTGLIDAEQIVNIFNHLPVDITFVDENDIVRFFSTPKKRIFPRTKAIIGRDVHNCHPKESVHVVEEIVSSFKSGEKDEASFWINFKAEKILIQYFALRDEKGQYKGVIEVTQEISGIQQLEGEKRLLDWTN